MANSQLDPEIAAMINDTATAAPTGTHFTKGSFMQKLLEGVKPEVAQRVASDYKKVITTTDKEEKMVFRQRLIISGWNLYSELAKKIMHIQNCKEKLYYLRYGCFNYDALDPKQQDILSSLSWKVSSGDFEVYYADEWLYHVATGKVKASMVDEVATKSRNDASGLQDKYDRKKGSYDAELMSLEKKILNRKMIEDSFVGMLKTVLTHQRYPEFNNLQTEYSQDQINMLSNISSDTTKLRTLDKQIASQYRALKNLKEDLEKVKAGMAGGGADIDDAILENEFSSLRQMAKMCVGPQGNHLSILFKEYMPMQKDYINTKENVCKLLEEIEHTDAGVFKRTFKGEENRIAPYIILLPSYGESGICWEPFDIKNRATSRGRIAIPMYPRNPKLSLLAALGDIRWQVAKEKAAYRWMEEGLTGKYYNYYTEQKLRGNIKEYFVKDYILWITMEYQGMQKLHRDSRPIFWRHVPFPKEKREELKNRGFFYADLYKRDERRAQSDGY